MFNYGVTSSEGVSIALTFYIFLPSVLFFVTDSEKGSCTQGKSYH